MWARFIERFRRPMAAYVSCLVLLMVISYVPYRALGANPLWGNVFSPASWTPNQRLCYISEVAGDWR